MIKYWFITGDVHGSVVPRLQRIKTSPHETALIILGDAGINFYLNKTDEKNKRNINNTGYLIYCVRGNHEERPDNLSTMIARYDNEVQGWIFQENQYPNIRYLIDGNTYTINGKSTLVIGGAYSVDKWYRLSHAKPGDTWTGWFPEEQLTEEEMNTIENKYRNNHFDLVLTHTCPYSWQPVDLFLPFLDQSTVDNTMEKWMESFKDTITYNKWYFGHYHADRNITAKITMLYKNIEELV